MTDIVRVGGNLSDHTRWQSITGIHHAVPVPVREAFLGPGEIKQNKAKSAEVSKFQRGADRSL